MYTVLVADSDRSFAQALSARVNREENCRVVAQAYDGKSAIALIEAERPDIIVIDFLLPEADGLYVVQHVKHAMENYQPAIHMLSYFSNAMILSELQALRVDFFNSKPVSVDNILYNIRKATEQSNNNGVELQVFPRTKSLKNTVTDLVIQFGVFPHRLSTKCIIDALVHYIENPDGVQALTKILYPEIAKKHNITSYAVERNIRGGIEIMQKACTPLFLSIFPNAASKRVTNGEFMATIAYYLDESPVYKQNYSC